MKMRHFGKFTKDFWKFNTKKINCGKFTILWEYFHGNRYSTLVKFPYIYGVMPRGGGTQVKIDHTFNNCGGQVDSCCAQGYGNKSCRIFYKICLINFH
jgi:hypothetical protein